MALLLPLAPLPSPTAPPFLEMWAVTIYWSSLNSRMYLQKDHILNCRKGSTSRWQESEKLYQPWPKFVGEKFNKQDKFLDRILQLFHQRHKTLYPLPFVNLRGLSYFFSSVFVGSVNSAQRPWNCFQFLV